MEVKRLKVKEYTYYKVGYNFSTLLKTFILANK